MKSGMSGSNLTPILAPITVRSSTPVPDKRERSDSIYKKHRQLINSRTPSGVKETHRVRGCAGNRSNAWEEIRVKLIRPASYNRCENEKGAFHMIPILLGLWLVDDQHRVFHVLIPFCESVTLEIG